MERPILFSGPMVRAILDGRKTVTRRIVRGVEMPRCPYGSPGDRLWVRETWCLAHPDYHDTDREAGSRPVKDGRFYFYAATDDVDTGDGSPWKPSIHMPRWASRITLEVVCIRVERLQEIDEVDILAEGVTVDVVAKLTGTPWADMPTLHHAWERLWDSINGDRASWASNPWVWRVEFRRVQP